MSRTRLEAVAQGHKRYFTGVPCRHGHLAERRTHNSECCECARLGTFVYSRKKIQENPSWSCQKARAYRNHLSENSSDPDFSIRVAKELLRHARRRAKKKELLFNLVPEDLLPIPINCPVLKTPLLYFGSERNNKNNAASVDRIENEKGYVPGNVRIISWRANHIKTDATIEEVEAVLKYMKGSRE